MKISFELAAEARNDEGKGASRRLRHAGRVPAILYGGKDEPQSLSFNHEKLLTLIENEKFYSTIVGINVGGNLTFSGSTTLSLDFGGLGTGSVAWSNAFWDVAQQWVLYSVGGSTTGTSNFTLLSNTNSWIDSAGVAFSSSSRKDNKFEVVQEGNNVLLQYVIVPEPAAVTLALIGIAAAAYAARRRRS